MSGFCRQLREKGYVVRIKIEKEGERGREKGLHGEKKERERWREGVEKVHEGM